MRLRCFFLLPGMHPSALQPFSSVLPLSCLIKQLELKNRQSTNILLFAHKHIYRVCQCREWEREGSRGGGLHPRVFGFTRSQRGTAWTPFGHLFFGPVKNCVNMLVISTCLSLCAVVHLALDKHWLPNPDSLHHISLLSPCATPAATLQSTHLSLSCPPACRVSFVSCSCVAFLLTALG